MVEKIRVNSVLSGKEIVVLLVAVIPWLGFGPLDASEQAKSLAHVSGVRVVVKIGLSKEGPARQILQNDVENKFRERDVRLIEEILDHNQVPSSSLYIEVAIWKMPGRPYIYFINANFYQAVQLVGNSNFSTLAATWQKGFIGEGDMDRIRQDVTKITDIFLVSLNKNMEKSPS